MGAKASKRMVSKESEGDGGRSNKYDTYKVHRDAGEEKKRLLRKLSEQREEERKIRESLIEAIFKIAEELDVENRRLNIADTTLSATGIVGGSLVVIGFGLSFATAGTSLALTIAGGVIGGLSGGGALSSQISRFFITKRQWRKIKMKVLKITKQSEKIQETIKEVGKIGAAALGTAGTTYSVVKNSFRLADVADDVVALARGGATAGKLSTRTATASKSLFTSMGSAGKALHFVGFGASVLGIGIDIYTIVDRAKKIHKKQPAKAAEQMRRLAFRLKGPHKHQPSTCDRRMIEMEFRSIFATY